jgi:DNA (cytosine-5)-methyltransferase 1
MVKAGVIILIAKRRLLDLFCCEGVGAWGYWNSGMFSEIVGVDINNERRSSYSFDFIHADALTLDYDFLMDFDFIHASPPCQAYSGRTPDKSRHMRLIAATKLMLAAAGIPHVIENVEGSSKELKPNLVMDGHYFGLPSERRRYFYVSTLTAPLRLMSTGKTINVHGWDYVSRLELIKALGLEVINHRRLANISMIGMEQAIAPAMTKHIAQLVFNEKVGIE